MSRREIVLLVSRAIALLQIIAALIDSFIYLPQQVFLLSQRMKLTNAFPGTHAVLGPVAWVGIVSSLVHIVALLVVAVLFWRCGPMIERLFLPADSMDETAGEGI